jgi:hypothetical protein
MTNLKRSGLPEINVSKTLCSKMVSLKKFEKGIPSSTNNKYSSSFTKYRQTKSKLSILSQLSSGNLKEDTKMPISPEG